MIHLDKDEVDLAVVYDHLLSFVVKTEMYPDNVLEMLLLEVER